MKKSELKVVTFEDVLKRSNSDIRSDKAKRLSSSTGMAYMAKVNATIKQIFDVDDEIEAMIDISASNVTTTANRVEKFDSTSFVDRRASLLLKKVLLEQELKVLKDDASFYNVTL